MSRGLRFARVADMPEGMRAAMEKTERRYTRADTPNELRRDGLAAPVRARKYGNVVTTIDGIRFDSKREARFYEMLKLRRAAGEVAYWLRQVPVHLPGGTRYVIDFLVFYADGRAPEYVDVKGRETKEFKIKRREVEHHYPIRVVLA